MTPRGTPLHVAIAGWLLGEPSGANRRLLALLAAIAPRLQASERVTVLHRPDYAPPTIPGIAWSPVAIPAGPPLRRIRAERRLLPGTLRDLGAAVLDHGFLPLPRVPVPTCLLVHDVRRLDRGGFAAWAARLVLRRSLQRATAVVAPSMWTAQRLRDIAPDCAPHVVHNGVQPAPAAPPPVPFACPANGYLLHAGHVEARKNLAVVIAALGRLPPATRPELWLAGADHGALAGLVQQAKMLAVPLRPLGVVAEDLLAALYAHANAVVMPSRHEGFGLPALEALAHGRPVLVAAGSALPEVVGDAGAVLPADDVEAWARALAEAAAERNADGAAPAARQAHRRARAAQFDWPTAAELLLRVWRRIHA